VSKWKAGCSSKASLHREGHEDHNNEGEPLMSINEDKVVEVDYDFRKGIAFMQIELGLKEEDVEEVQGKSNKAHSASFKLTEQVDW
jgi:hypothetical protein